MLSTVPPTVGVLIWLFELGPVPQLHLTAPLMLIHVVLDGYAFVGTHMFDTNPATQRVAERSGMDSLSDPVLVVDSEEQVVRVNQRAEELFMNDSDSSFPVPLERVVGGSLEAIREAEEISIETNGSRVFTVSHTELRTPTGELVGAMLVLYNTTAQRQRRQQLSVLNRVLRHNLRNETTVINGYAELLKTSLTDDQHAEQAATIEAAGKRLSSIGEKAEDFEEVQERGEQPEVVSIPELIDDIEQHCTDTYSNATVERIISPSDLTLCTDRVLLYMLLKNLVENAIAHSESAEPTAWVTVSPSQDDSRDVHFEIRDENDPIPDHEIQVLRAGEETPLQHGQGIGLWIVYWCVQKLHADIDFAYDDGNVITVTIRETREDADRLEDPANPSPEPAPSQR